MKKVFVTGITGTLAPYLKKALIKQGFDVIDKHFRINQEEELELLERYLEEEKPRMIFHLALGPISMSKVLAEYAKKNQIPFIYISTVSVFEDNEGGPYTKESMVHVKNEYGKYKYDCELAVRSIYPKSHIIRIGWQISPTGETCTNNMFRFIKENTNAKNEITVSDAFYPSVSFLDDTADAIIDLTNKEPDLYLVNSNHHLSLYEIIQTLNEKFELYLTVLKDSSFQRNDIMDDHRVLINKL